MQASIRGLPAVFLLDKDLKVTKIEGRDEFIKKLGADPVLDASDLKPSEGKVVVIFNNWADVSHANGPARLRGSMTTGSRASRSAQFARPRLLTANRPLAGQCERREWRVMAK